MNRFLLLFILILTLFACRRQEPAANLPKAPFLQSNSPWVDSVLLSMSVDDKIAQLLVYQPELEDTLQKNNLIRLVQNNSLGGVILQHLNLSDYLRLYDTLQSRSAIPLFNGTRELVSLHNQFADITDLPNAATISAINDDDLKQRIRSYYKDQLSTLGINLSFAPGMDLNDPAKPYKFRGAEAEESLLLRRSVELLDHIQSEKILSVAGQFDEFHYELENDTTGLLDSTLCRYRTLSQQGLSGILADHEVFDIDSIHLMPPHFLKRYLRRHLDFEGLVFADWEDNSFRELAYAGVDVFIVKDNFEKRFETIRRLVDEGTFTRADLNEKVQKILLAKAWMGLDTIYNQPDFIRASDLMTLSFNDFEIQQMYEASICLTQNPGNLLPFLDTQKEHFRIIQIGERELLDFQNSFSKYTDFSSRLLRPDTNGVVKPLSVSRLKRAKVILTVDNHLFEAGRDSAFLASVHEVAKKAELTLLNFGSPINLTHFDTTIAMVQVFEKNALTADLSAQLLFGAIQAKGRLPIALNKSMPFLQGIDSTAIVRLKYTVPEEVGIAAYQLVGLDAIARTMIQEKATPGCQVLVAKDGKVIYSKSFGKHSFEKSKLVQDRDLYDLASITKIASTTLGFMKLYDEQKVKLKHPLKQHLDLEKKSRLKNINMRQLLTHQSGLQPNMPIAPFILYEDTTGTGCSGYFCKEKVLSYITPVADSFYMDFKWQDSIWQAVYDLKPSRRKRYRYSDVNFNLLMQVIEKQSGMALDEFVEKSFYDPMHLDRLRYNPLEHYDKKSIVPTTKEERFRKQMIHGYVHDESAALLGGVGGNAGLFGNAESLAVLFQMLLNEGEYGGKKYISKETIELFTKKQRGTNRGLGFDVNAKAGTNACSPKASPETFGHTGFTGTCVWVDPKEDLIFIFLSNRIHPDVNNRKLFKKQVRKRMHNLVYEALNTYPEIKEAPKAPEFMEASVPVDEE